MTQDDALPARVNLFLAKLCAELGGAPASLDERGVVGLSGRIQGRDVAVTVAVHPKEGLISFSSPVGALPAGEPGEALSAALLGLNLVPGDTAGMAFARIPPHGTVVLTYSLLGPDHRFPSFRAAFFRLFGTAAAWQERLGQLDAARQGKASAPHSEGRAPAGTR